MPVSRGSNASILSRKGSAAATSRNATLCRSLRADSLRSAVTFQPFVRSSGATTGVPASSSPTRTYDGIPAPTS